MPKTKISEFSSTPANNTDIDSINIAENCPPSGINDAIRELMAQLKDFQTGAVGDSFNGPVGTTTAAAGAFTTLSSTGNTTLGDASGDSVTINGTATFANANPTLSAGTANGVAYLNGSKVVTSGSALTFDGTNLGVGTTSPAAKLGVAGNIFISGASSYIAFDATQSGSTPAFIQYASNSLVFGAGSSEQMRLTSTGLGIGTSSPAQTLHVKTSTAATPITLGVLSNSTTLPALSFNGAYASTTMAGTYSLSGSLYTTVPSGAAQYFSIADSIKATLDSSGNLGLGVTPSAWGLGKALQIAGSTGFLGFSGANGNTVTNGYYDGGNYRYISNGFALMYGQVGGGGGVHAWHTAPSGTAGNAITFTQAMTLTAAGELLVGATTNTSGLRILASDGTVSTGFLPASTIAYTGTWTNHAFGFATNGTEKARIDSSGNLLVGTTSNPLGDRGLFASAQATNNSFALVSTDDSSGGTFIAFRNSAYTAIGTVARVTTTNAVVYNTTSDYRLKTVTGAVTGQGARIDALNPIDYLWTEGGQQARGFLAHEFQEVYPNSVTGDKDAVDANGNPVYQAMQASTAEVIADLVAEIKALRVRVAQLESN